MPDPIALESNRQLEAALSLAALGWRVLPTGPDKAPLIRGGVHSATTDARQIVEWWTKKWPNANPALATDGAIVIDLDAGSEAWAAREDVAVALLAAGAICKTPKGGRHFYFRLPPDANFKSWVRRLPGVDLRTGPNAYVLVPPGQTADGRYEWAVELTSAPEHLPPLPDILRRELEGRGQSNVATWRPSDGLPDEIQHGTRNVSLYKVAAYLRRTGMGYDPILAALRELNKLCQSPLVDGDLMKIARSAESLPPNQALMAALSGHAPPTPGSDAAAFVDAIAVAPEPVDWLAPGVIAAGRLSLLSGRPKTGKSLATAALAAALSTGTPDGPFEPRCVGRTVFIQLEDDEATTVVPRLIAHNADLSKITFVREPWRWNVSDTAMLDALLAARPDTKLLVIDPLPSFLPPGVSINDEAAIRQAMLPLLAWAKATRVAVLLVSHHRKMSPMGRISDIDSETLGATGIVGIVRNVLHIRRYREPDGVMKHYLGFGGSNLAAREDEWNIAIEAVDVGNDVIGQRITWRKRLVFDHAIALVRRDNEAKPWIVATIAAAGGTTTQAELTRLYAERFRADASSGHTRSQVRDLVNELVREGAVSVSQQGRNKVIATRSGCAAESNMSQPDSQITTATLDYLTARGESSPL